MNVKSRTIWARMHGVLLALSSTRRDFLDFAADYLSPLRVYEKTSLATGAVDAIETVCGRSPVTSPSSFRIDAHDAVSTPDIRVTLAWKSGRGHGSTFSVAGEERQQLGRRLWISDHRLGITAIWQLPGLAMEVSWEHDHLSVRATYTWPSRRARWASHWLPAVRERLFVGLIYYLVYFPWGWWLERERGWTMMHAAAVTEGGRGIILAGLPGSGKSSTTLAFLNRSGWRILSDNLLFTDGRRVFACLEPIHVDQRTAQLVGGMSGWAHSTGRQFSHHRWDYEIPPEARGSAAMSRVLGFLRIGERTEVRRLPLADSLRRLMANDYLAKEWLAYQETAAMLHQLFPRIGDQTRRRENLLFLVGSSSCYQIALARDTSLQSELDYVLAKVWRAGQGGAE